MNDFYYDYDFIERKQFRLNLQNQKKIEQCLEKLRNPAMREFCSWNSISVECTAPKRIGIHAEEEEEDDDEEEKQEEEKKWGVFTPEKHVGLDPETIDDLCEILRLNHSIKALSISLPRSSASAFRQILQALSEEDNSIESLSLVGHVFSPAMLRDFSAFLRNRNTKIGSLTLNVKANQDQLVLLICQALESNASIRVLELASSMLSEESTAHVSSLLRTNRFLKKLVFNYCILFSASGSLSVLAKSLRNNSSIDCVTFNNTEIGPGCSDLGRMLGCRSLESLHFVFSKVSGDSFRSLAHGLRENSTLRSLKLSGNSMITPEDMLAFSDSLAANRTLEEISFANCQLGDQSISYLSAALASNESLTILNLGSCSFGARGLTDIGKMLARNRTLKKLMLYCNQFDINQSGPSGYFTEALASNRCLQYLDLSLNSFERDAFRSIFSALAQNASLVNLELSNCDVEPDALCHIFDCLEANRVLKHLSLGGNSISTEFAAAFGRCKYLTSLDLNHCSFEGDSFRILCAMLRENQRIESLYLAECSLEDKDLDHISDCLKENRKLKSVELQGNSFSLPAIESLIRSMQDNHAIQSVKLQKYGSLLSSILGRNRDISQRKRRAYMTIIEFIFQLNESLFR